MKATFAVVILAITMGVQSSVIDLGHHGLLGHGLLGHEVLGHGLLGHGLLGHGLLGHGILGHPAAISLAQGPALVGHHGIALAHGPVVAAHHASVVHAPAVHAHVPAVAVHAPAVLAHEGQYVAKTRGALHAAPLAGHIQSVKSVNVEPAPGTH